MHAKNVTEMKKKIPSPHCDLRLHLQIKNTTSAFSLQTNVLLRGDSLVLFLSGRRRSRIFWRGTACFHHAMIVCFLEPLSAALKLRASSLLGRGISVVKTWNPTPALLRTPSIHLVLSLKIRKSIWILISIVITHASVIQRGADSVEHWKNMQYAIAFQSWNLMFALMHKKENCKNRYYFTMQRYSLYFRVP